MLNVNLDDVISAADVLQVINRINADTAGTAREGESLAIVNQPQPSNPSAMLSSSGLDYFRVASDSGWVNSRKQSASGH
jgi:hypothetical protein